MPLGDASIDAQWLRDETLQTLFDILTADGGEAMIAGGAVRNALMDRDVSDIDLATTLLPEEVINRLEAVGQKAVPTGIEHGTITAVLDGKPFEITTLREDIETDGRYAVVQFGTDWKADAKRRDLTMNGLYCDRQGRVYDWVGGYADLVAGNVRFIGKAHKRIEEDALRILRFFRFFAWYGSGRPDEEGLKACGTAKEQITAVSVERIWMELKKLLAAPDPSRALLWMRTTGVLSQVLPEAGKWGMDAVPGLIAQEQSADWKPDAMLRLMAMIRPDSDVVVGLSKRLSFAKTEAKRLQAWVESSPPNRETSERELEQLLYRGDMQGFRDAMMLEAVHLKNQDDEEGAAKMVALIAHANSWPCPIFPVTGQDLLDARFEAGPKLGKRLCMLEEEWIESGFALTREALLKSV